MDAIILVTFRQPFMNESKTIDNAIEAAVITSTSINIVSGIDLESSTKQSHGRSP